MGGIWERVIRSVRRVLCGITKQQNLTDDSLYTLFSEAEYIVNSRPLTPVVLDASGDEPLTPNHLLLLRSGDHTCGKFTPDDKYVRKRWRHVQHLADQFWIRWKKEYLQTLQTRQKWQGVQPNFTRGDIVLMYDPTLPRGKWPLARVIETYSDDHGHVRQVLVQSQNKTFKRPISKLCKLLSENCSNATV